MIARVTVSDLDELIPLMRGYCDLYEVAPGDAALRALALTLIEHPDTSGVQLLARDEQGTAIGFATLFWSYSTLSAAAIGVMNDLYVDAAARARGVGAALIRACEAACANRGVGAMEWQTAPTNTRAQSLYDRFDPTRAESISYTLAVTPR